MKLLLTSAGITNKSIKKAFFELVDKKPEDISIAFIPTAMNVESEDKTWFIDNLIELKNLNVKSVDVVDISALPKEKWLPRLEEADVLFFSGGNSPHLMRWLKESGLAAIIRDLLKTRVYAGISAGEIVTSPTLALSNADKLLYYEEWSGYSDKDALGLVDFYTRPHLNSPHFPNVREAQMAEIAKTVDKPLYVLDDDSALKIIDGKVEVVSEGEYLVFNT